MRTSNCRKSAILQNELDLRDAKEKLKSDLDKIPNCKKTGKSEE